MRSAAARTRTRAGLRLLALGLRQTGYDDAMVNRIGFSAHGRPEITGAPVFSISHSRTLIACALAENGRTVGLDVEARRAGVAARLARILSAQEREIVAHDGARFFDFWCAREAVVKASGRVGLARIRALTLNGDHARLDGHDWPLTALDLLPGYAACVASDQPIGDVTIEECAIAAD